mgnify:CR=1 FL=1
MRHKDDYHQIENYARSGIFSGLFSLVQVFVAMEPKETVYFANPGPDGKFNKDFYFHWADFNNEPINEWGDIASFFLSIPMAHQLIGFYTVPDGGDGIKRIPTDPTGMPMDPHLPSDDRAKMALGIPPEEEGGEEEPVEDDKEFHVKKGKKK